MSLTFLAFLHSYFGVTSSLCCELCHLERKKLSSEFLFQVSISAVLKARGSDTYLISIDRRVTETEMEGNRSRPALPKSILKIRSSSACPSGSAAAAQTCNFMPKSNSRFNSSALSHSSVEQSNEDEIPEEGLFPALRCVSCFI